MPVQTAHGRPPMTDGAPAKIGEQVARKSDPIPDGYKFVRKGNVYITQHCRIKTHEAGKTLYVVLDKINKPIGLRCPKYIFNAVLRENEATAAKRAAVIQRRDATLRKQFEEAVAEIFPSIPRQDLQCVIMHTLKKRSRRVGRTNKFSLHQKVRLAVSAHVRHAHTNYEELLEQRINKLTAREIVLEKVNKVTMRWGGQPLKSPSQPPKMGRQAKRPKST
ncbi:hypothetical protein VTJ04DRAFT_170 [Mycothermus thermophilus]|uniref:uncharacterized protein n=1 Tax=Humicola insolens TaxID=85995 RepID=UPI003741FAEA